MKKLLLASLSVAAILYAPHSLLAGDFSLSAHVPTATDSIPSNATLLSGSAATGSIGTFVLTDFRDTISNKAKASTFTLRIADVAINNSKKITAAITGGGLKTNVSPESGQTNTIALTAGASMTGMAALDTPISATAANISAPCGNTPCLGTLSVALSTVAEATNTLIPGADYTGVVTITVAN